MGAVPWLLRLAHVLEYLPHLAEVQCRADHDALPTSPTRQHVVDLSAACPTSLTILCLTQLEK